MVAAVLETGVPSARERGVDAEFWHERWAANQIGFHEGTANAQLIAHLPALGLAPGARVFLPLCGKTRDIAWLRARGHPVAGAELSRLAVEQLFDELGVAPQIVPEGALTRFRAEGLDVLVGDVFALTRDRLGPVAAVYDRAALVALPEGVRPRYGAHLHAISGGAPQLLVSFEYDQAARSGPPFSVDRAEVERVYGGLYRLRELARTALRGGLRGGVAAEEVAWLLDRGAASPSAPPASR